jgi:hypothetical protein
MCKCEDIRNIIRTDYNLDTKQNFEVMYCESIFIRLHQFSGFLQNAGLNFLYIPIRLTHTVKSLLVVGF